jgi:predicted Rossmann-fold nucleotide-binding protein
VRCSLPLLLILVLGSAAPAAAGTVVLGPRGNPVAALPHGASTRLVIGVMGGAGNQVKPRVAAAVRAVGRTIATLGHVTLTGACPGYPNEAIVAAKQAGGLTIGISGFANKKAHVASGAPAHGFDVLQFTTLPASQRGQARPNYMGRELDEIERANALIYVGGRSGTLGEFAIAYEAGRPIGVLSGSGGITDQIKSLVKTMTREGKPPRAPVVYDSDPSRLVRRLVKAAQPKREKNWNEEG